MNVTTARQWLGALFRRVNAEPTGLAAAALATIACALFSRIFWAPLGFPTQALGAIIPAGRLHHLTQRPDE